MTKRVNNNDNDVYNFENRCSFYAMAAFFNFIAFMIYGYWGYYYRCSYHQSCLISSCGGEMNALPAMNVIPTAKFTSYRHQYLGKYSIITDIIIILIIITITIIISTLTIS